MSRPVVVPDPEVSGVVRISMDPSLPAPNLAVFGAMHGNEPCGLEAIGRVRREIEAGELALGAGTIVLVHGNQEATRQGRRHGVDGVDLNRLFDWRFVEEVPRERWTLEHQRAVALRPVLESADALLDLHSSTSPTPPFAILNEVDTSFDLAARLGLAYVTRGWFGPGFLGDRTTLGVLARRNLPAVGVECGQHDDPNAPDVGHECALRFLRACGGLAGQRPGVAPTTQLGMFAPVTRPSDACRFVRPLRGLDRLRAGEVFARDAEHEVRVDEDCYALLPNDTVDAGDDMLYLARLLDSE